MTFDFRSVMSGKRRDPLAFLMRGGLWIASWPYRLAVAIRNTRYDNGKRPTVDCGVPVISVGNLTTGGTGKTPIVCYLAAQLRDRSVRVAIVSRGYKRGEADENDEALELHSRLPDVPHIQNPDRPEAARIAVEELESQVILMDDGFQHRRLQRDQDIVVIDATCPFGYGHLLPRGLLRESMQSLRRADLVIVSRCGIVTEPELNAIESKIASINSNVPVVRSDHQPRTLLTYPEQRTEIQQLAGQRVAVICAIGNPDAFVETVQLSGATVVATRFLPDHDTYDPETMTKIRDWIRLLGDQIDQVVCTHKDLVKIRSDQIAGKPIQAILIELTLLGDATAVDALLDSVTRQVAEQEA